ncbi:hypothetical protein RclHR1_05900010 [Rhizophagus clarus]|uniref:Attractin/MKLN-like beta-propeller domain-containing protein n=1 Tax=Rhizophagus clarus TaxID=94130 RepID=A0A2Z6RVH6_9GLOM|nr:hypothetical protein RclHR1_05900010 [Rhizophagus clarus]GES84467.1 hypothetical protein GLOIN_2v1836168 [Rhizophagus clarus]
MKTILFLLIILSTGICQTITNRYGQSSVLVDKKLYFFGGIISNNSLPLNQLLQLDLSKSFNTTNPPFEILNVATPFGGSFTTAFLSPQKDVIYIYGGVTINSITINSDALLHTFNLETNKWDIPKTKGIVNMIRSHISGVINNETGKFYAFGGNDGISTVDVLDGIDILDVNSLTWSGSSLIDVVPPIPVLVDYTATLLPNGFIIFIGGYALASNAFQYIDMNNNILYNTKTDKWARTTTQGVVETRGAHSAVLTPDQRIIIYGGFNGNGNVINQLAVLDTKANPFSWSIPSVSGGISPILNCHSSALVGNYMFMIFGKNSPDDIGTYDESQAPFFYILDVSNPENYTWVTQFGLENSPTTTAVNTLPTDNGENGKKNPEKPDNGNGRKIGIIFGIIISIVVSIAGFLVYRFLKKRNMNRYAPQAKQCVSYN